MLLEKNKRMFKIDLKIQNNNKNLKIKNKPLIYKGQEQFICQVVVEFLK